MICLSSSCVLCSQCCHCRWNVNSLLSLRFSITFYFYNVLQKLQYAWQICLSSLLCSVRFPHENDVRFVFTSSCLLEGSRLIDVICVCLCIGVSNIIWRVSYKRQELRAPVYTLVFGVVYTAHVVMVLCCFCCCFACLRPVSCVSRVASVSGLLILYCPF